VTSVCLLDVNVLIALMWPAHEHHPKVQRWFGQHARSGWATCPITQAGFIRLITNPALTTDAIPPEQAIRVLETVTDHPAHRFWPDAITVPEALRPAGNRLTGHKQVMDAYLIGLARHHKGSVATLDRALHALLSSDEQRTGRVTLI
jgi:toxin-antitoxin system PIN domain toxin